MTCIVTYAHRAKRPTRKSKAVSLAGPTVVWTAESPKPVVANDDRKPAIVTTTDQKRLKLLRVE